MFNFILLKCQEYIPKLMIEHVVSITFTLITHDANHPIIFILLMKVISILREVYLLASYGLIFVIS